jgi:cysteine synthase
MENEYYEEPENVEAHTNKVGNIIMRIFAVFVATALATIGAGSLLGIDALLAAGLAGTMAVAVVVERLARNFLDDGKLDGDEINESFKD